MAMTEKDNSNITGQFVLDDEISQDVAKIIRKRLSTYNGHRKKLLKEVQANMAYLIGEQNIYYEDGQIKPITDRRQLNPVANLILPAVQKDVAVATQNPPHYDIVPAGTDDDDRATALVAQKIGDHLSRKPDVSRARELAVLWYDIAGVGWTKVYWDPFAVVLGANPPAMTEEGTPNPLHNPQIPEGEAVVQGEVRRESVPITQLVYDFRETDLTRLEWIIHCKTVTRHWVNSMYGPETAQKLQGKFTANTAESEFEASIQYRFNAVSDEIQQITTPKMPDNAKVDLDADQYIDYYEYWQKPTKQSPMGLYAVMLADQVIFHAPYPYHIYPHGELPFSPAAPMSLGASIGSSVPRISQARPLQREYNRLRAQISENIDIMGNAVIFAPKQSKLRHRTLDNGAGNIIEYDGLGKPTREPGVSMNSQVFAYLAEVRENLERLFAFNEVSRGVAPRNIESGRGIMALQDADRLHMQPMVRGFEEADRRVLYQSLSLALHNYEQGRLVHTIGSDYEWTLYEVDREQMRGKFNIIVKPYSSMPSNKEAEAAQAFELWSSGLLGDPQDPEIRVWTLEQMHLGNNENMLQRHSKQKNFAAKEFTVAYANLKDFQIPPGATWEAVKDEIEKRTFVPNVNPFDDDMIPIMVINEFLLDKYWEIVNIGNPIYLDLLNNMFIHLQLHQQRVQAQQEAAYQRELQSQMLIKGTTPAQIAQRSASRSDDQTSSKKGS